MVGAGSSMSDIGRAAEKAQESLELLVSLGFKVIVVYILYLAVVKVILPGLAITIPSRKNNNADDASNHEVETAPLTKNIAPTNYSATALTKLSVVRQKLKYPNSEIQNYSSVVRGGFNTVIC